MPFVAMTRSIAVQRTINAIRLKVNAIENPLVSLSNGFKSYLELRSKTQLCAQEALANAQMAQHAASSLPVIMDVVLFLKPFAAMIISTAARTVIHVTQPAVDVTRVLSRCHFTKRSKLRRL